MGDRHASERTIDSTYGGHDDERSPLVSGQINSTYGDRVPRLKDPGWNPGHRDSTDSVDVELPVKPKKKHNILFKITLMAILVCSGASMTLCMKNQDQTCLEHCESNNTNHSGHTTLYDANGNLIWGMFYPGPYSPDFLLELADPVSNDTELKPHYFHQPFFQLFHLGFGQILSGAFTPLFDTQEIGLKPISFRQFFPQAALASLFDVCAEILIILGLSLTHASVTEMLKTTMVVFVGLLSLYFFPGFIINWKQWCASFIMLCGSLLVILQSYLTGATDADTVSETLGAFLVIAAQLFYGLEFVVEEKLIDHSKIKGLHVNKAVLVFALGVLSMTGACILQLPWQAITSDFQSLPDEIKQYFEYRSLWLSGIGISIAVMGFDLAGLGISEVMGSDRRAISVAAFQVAIVWSISIGVGWEDFSWLSLAGFLMILGSGVVYVLTSKEKSEPHQERKKKLKVPA